jgi:hypothetical protein
MGRSHGPRLKVTMIRPDKLISEFVQEERKWPRGLAENGGAAPDE